MADETRVAVLHQAIPPPIINGVRKPMKPGGYKDSSADIAYILHHHYLATVITPVSTPHPSRDEDWYEGANVLWANTILFASHPLEQSHVLGQVKDPRVVGQPPLLVEQYDD